MSKRITLAALFFLLLTPLLQMQFKIFPEKALDGKTERKAIPSFQLASFKKGEFQSSFESWLKNNLGLRGKIIRTDNQLNYSVFGVIPSRSHSPLILGKDNFLFEQSYLDNYNRLDPLPIKELESLTNSLKELQTKLKQQKVEFLLWITPSKAEIYSDKIPKKLIRSDREEKADDYQRFVKLLEKSKINYLDSVPKVKALRESSEYEVFAKGGTHWSYHTACKMASIVSSRIGDLLKKNTAEIPCEPVEILEPKKTDRDIIALANIWDESPFNLRIPYPPKKMQFSWDDYHPKVLIVGDSFTWTPLEYFDQHGTFIKRKFYYYYKSQYTAWVTKDKDGKPKRKVGLSRKLKKADIDWQNDMFDRDIVIITVNQREVSAVGHGFIEDALAKLNSK